MSRLHQLWHPQTEEQLDRLHDALVAHLRMCAACSWSMVGAGVLMAIVIEGGRYDDYGRIEIGPVQLTAAAMAVGLLAVYKLRERALYRRYEEEARRIRPPR